MRRVSLCYSISGRPALNLEFSEVESLSMRHCTAFRCLAGMDAGIIAVRSFCAVSISLPSDLFIFFRMCFVTSVIVAAAFFSSSSAGWESFWNFFTESLPGYGEQILPGLYRYRSPYRLGEQTNRRVFSLQDHNATATTRIFFPQHNTHKCPLCPRRTEQLEYFSMAVAHLRRRHTAAQK